MTPAEEAQAALDAAFTLSGDVACWQLSLTIPVNTLRHLRCPKCQGTRRVTSSWGYFDPCDLCPDWADGQWRPPAPTWKGPR